MDIIVRVSHLTTSLESSEGPERSLASLSNVHPGPSLVLHRPKWCVKAVHTHLTHLFKLVAPLLAPFFCIHPPNQPSFYREVNKNCGLQPKQPLKITGVDATIWSSAGPANTLVSSCSVVVGEVPLDCCFHIMGVSLWVSSSSNQKWRHKSQNADIIFCDSYVLIFMSMWPLEGSFHNTAQKNVQPLVCTTGLICFAVKLIKLTWIWPPAKVWCCVTPSPTDIWTYNSPSIQGRERKGN